MGTSFSMWSVCIEHANRNSDSASPGADTETWISVLNGMAKNTLSNTSAFIVDPFTVTVEFFAGAPEASPHAESHSTSILEAVTATAILDNP